MPSSADSKNRIEHAVLSDTGMRRPNNQDSALVVCEGDAAGQRGSLFIVADGMGAHAAGELASKLAVENVSHAYQKSTEISPHSALRQAVQKANGLIHAKGQSNAEFRGMGTTCTSLLVVQDAALVAHVGDSRAYRLRGERLEQLTFDHSLVWELAAASQTTERDVPDCIPKHVITRSLGPHPVVNVDLEGPFDLDPGDTFLLCSDGLTGVVEDELLGAVLAAMPPEDAAQTLVDLANLRGGPDNITVAIVRAGEPQPDGPTTAKNLPTSKKPSTSQHPDSQPVLWGTLILGLLCLGAVIYCISEQYTWGAAGAAIAFGALLVRLVSGRVERSGALPVSLDGGPYGNAPYRGFDCGAGPKTTGALQEVLEELSLLRTRAAERNGAARVDWQQFDESLKEVSEASDWRRQLRAQGTALRRLMEQVRQAPDLAEKALGIAPEDSALE